MDQPTTVPGVRRLNHVVLWVSNAEESSRFYADALGLRVVHEMPGAVFMRAPGSGNDHDLGLFTTRESGPATTRQIGMYHMAWEVPTLGVLAERAEHLSAIGALVGASDHGVTKSLYVKDPDGIEFEVMWAVPPELITSNEAQTRPLDLAAEIQRYGADAETGFAAPDLAH